MYFTTYQYDILKPIFCRYSVTISSNQSWHFENFDGNMIAGGWFYNMIEACILILCRVHYFCLISVVNSFMVYEYMIKHSKGNFSF